MNELALFAGAGGGILGGKLLGWRTVCAVEWEPYPASVLCARQNDRLLPPFPIWDDVQTFDGKPWRGIVDVVSGGFPCQDISAAGKGAGIDGERSGMWKHMARVVSEVRPRYVFVENSPMLVTRGLERVLGDLTALGYDTKWTVMGAADVGANHQRDRIWIVGKLANASELFSNGGNNYSGISMEQKTESKLGNNYWSKNVANSSSQRWQADQHIGNIDGGKVCGSVGEQGKDGGKQSLDNTNFTGLERYNDKQESPKRIQQEFSQRCFKNAEEMADTNDARLEWWKQQQIGSRKQGDRFKNTNWWKVEPNVGRVADGVAARVDRLKAIGNGQVSLCAATAWRLLTA